MSNKVIEVKELYREYKFKSKGKKEVKPALKGISFDVYEGEIFGLLGPNGAGKTTTIKILTTLLTPTSGEVRIFNQDVVKEADQIRSAINVVFGGERGLYDRLTAAEFLQYFACLYKVPKDSRINKIDELLHLVGLEDKRDQKIYTFSKGMKQRMHIARGLINNPKIIFLDEPTIGLDPVVAENTRNLIKELTKKNVTIILTTHYMKEADDLCDRIGIISDGEIKASGTPKSLKEEFSFLNIYEMSARIQNKELLYEHKLMKNTKIEVIKEDYYFVRFEVEQGLSYDQIKAELSQIADVVSLEKKEVALEDAYINIVKAG